MARAGGRRDVSLVARSHFGPALRDIAARFGQLLILRKESRGAETKRGRAKLGGETDALVDELIVERA